MLRGFDASSVQGKLPWDKLDPALRFAIFKCYQGNDGMDPWFWKNVKACLESGRVPGAYFFAYPLPHLDPRAQAQIFFEQSKEFGTHRGELPPFIDLEWPPIVQPGKKGWKEWGCSPQQISDWGEAHCNEMTKLWGIKPILYTYDWWWAGIRNGAPAYGFPKGADVSWAAQYALWMAWYTSKWPSRGDNPRIPKPWTDWLFWQFDGNKGLKLPNGVDADFCVFNGTEEDLQKLAYGPVARVQTDFDIVHPLTYDTTDE